jgi:small-conductance mechanosensitive channel/CRP-like cAMP-binding protein
MYDGFPMPAWLLTLPEIIRADLHNGEAIGVTIAAALVALLWLTLPAHHKASVKQPVVFLLVHAAAHTLRTVLFYGDGNVGHALTVIAVVALLACIGRTCVALVFDVGFGRRLARPAPKIIRDLVLGIVYVFVALASLRAAGIELGSILTTSALLTAVIGLSLQETLGNLFAGLALQMQSPFDVGDWIQFGADQKTVGKVLEINWRATRMLTLDEVEVIVPNGTLGKAPISNYTKPSPRIRRSIYVHVAGTTPPRKAQRVIEEAIKGSWGVLDEPPPSVVTSDFDDSGIELWVRFWTDQFQKWGIVEGEVRDRIWYALAREGIVMTPPARNIFTHEINDEVQERQRAVRTTQNLESLIAVDFLAAIPRPELEKLARATKAHLYAEGELIVRKGETADEMYVVRTGEVAVLMPSGNGDGKSKKREVARLDEGKFFGEMALMTGEPRTADVVATRDSELLVLSHGALHATLIAHPELALTISRVISERQAKLEEADASTEPQEGRIEQRTSQLLGRIKNFFSLS